jgi:hypothetical protein
VIDFGYDYFVGEEQITEIYRGAWLEARRSFTVDGDGDTVGCFLPLRGEISDLGPRGSSESDRVRERARDVRESNLPDRVTPEQIVQRGPGQRELDRATSEALANWRRAVDRFMEQFRRLGL